MPPTSCYDAPHNEPLGGPYYSINRYRGSRKSGLCALRPDEMQTASPDAPYFANDLDGGGQNDNDNLNGSNGLNGNSGGMDAYARQMEQFTAGSNAPEIEYQPPPIEPIPPQPPQTPPPQAESTTFSTATSETSTSSSNQPISNVDARVLESILQEGKLDLSTEEQVKTLLDGPRLQEERMDAINKNAGVGGDSKYSSKFVSVSCDLSMGIHFPLFVCMNPTQFDCISKGRF